MKTLQPLFLGLILGFSFGNVLRLHDATQRLKRIEAILADAQIVKVEAAK